MVIKALLVLALEMVVCYLFGALIHNSFIKAQMNLLEKTLIGFFSYQIVCQVMSLTCYLVTGVLSHLSIAWAIAVVGISLLAIRLYGMQIMSEVKDFIYGCMNTKRYVLFMLITVFAFCYYVSINGEVNADSTYYIALVNTSVNTNSLFQVNPYNGYYGDAFFLRRALATFECHSAILCQLFQVEALIMSRIIRAIQNVLLTSGAVYLWGLLLYEKQKDVRYKKSCVLVITYLILQLVFACNAYTSATFLLQRAYEGKAFTANVVLLFTLYMSLVYLKKREKRILLVVGIICWGSVAISSSAMILAPTLAVLIIGSMKVTEWLERKGRIRCRE